MYLKNAEVSGFDLASVLYDLIPSGCDCYQLADCMTVSNRAETPGLNMQS